MGKLLLRHRWLALVLAFYLVLGVAYSVVTPLGESPDEVDHFLYVNSLTQQRRLPVMVPNAADNVTMEANQPPLYYFLGAAATVWLPQPQTADFPANTCFSFRPEDPGRQTFYLHDTAEAFPYRGTFLAFHLVRWLSLLLGTGTVLLTYTLGRQAALADGRVALLAAALVACNPQFIFINASANNDVLTALMGAAIVLLSTTAATRPSGKIYALLGVVLGLAALTKFGLFALWPLPFLALALNGWHGRGRRAVLLWAGLLLGLPLLIAGWWYVRGQLLYGDPLAWAVHLQAKGDQVLRTAPLAAADLRQFVVDHFQSYWLWFGWLNVKAPPWVYGLLLLLPLAAVAGWIRLAAAARRNSRISLRAWSRDGRFVALAFSLLAVGGVYVALLRYIQTINASGYQGRLAFAAAAPVAVLLAVGLVALLRRWSALPAVALGLLALGGLLLLSAAFPRPTIYQPSPGVARTCVRFDGGLMLEAYAAPQRFPPGETVPVTLVGYGLADTAAAQTVVVELRGRDGAIAGRAETELAWSRGEVVSATVALTVAADTVAARGVLAAGVATPAGAWQIGRSVSGRELPQPHPLTTVKIPPAAPVTAVAATPLHVSFGDELLLRGYDAVQSGAELALTLHWQALRPPTADYVTFVHLLDGDGNLLAQDDGQPQGGAYPPGVWDAGETVLDEKRLTLPQPLPPGSRLVVGVYRPETLQRLAATAADGTRLPQDVVPLPGALDGGRP